MTLFVFVRGKKITKLAENLKNPVSILHTQIRNKIAYLNETISNQELILKELLIDLWLKGFGTRDDIG